jgi:hypothetical protein
MSEKLIEILKKALIDKQAELFRLSGLGVEQSKIHADVHINGWFNAVQQELLQAGQGEG